MHELLLTALLVLLHQCESYDEVRLLANILVSELVQTYLFSRAKSVSKCYVEVLRAKDEPLVQVHDLRHNGVLLMVKVMLQMWYFILILVTISKTAIFSFFGDEIYNFLWRQHVN